MSFTRKKSRIEMALVGSGKFDFDQTRHQLQDVHLCVHLSEDVAQSPIGQAALLSAVALGNRCFGRVSTDGAFTVPYRANFPLEAASLEEAAVLLGASSKGEGITHSIVIGNALLATVAPVSVRATWQGWTATVSPSNQQVQECEDSICLAGIAAASLAVGELFQQRLGDVQACRRKQQISLWDATASSDAPPPRAEALQLPSNIWLIGLGNLGQAFVWALSSLDYADPKDVSLVLQDFDRVDDENFGTSILTGPDDTGSLKTLVAEDWCLGRNFRVSRIDRPIDEHTLVGHSEPRLAFSGLDKISVRKILGDRGFQYVVDAGLGSNATDFDRFRINTFDSAFSPAEHFKDQDDPDEHTRANKFIEKVKAMQDAMATATTEEVCGLLSVAGKSVAVPYVSMLAACLVVTQAIRLVSGYASFKSIVGQVRNLEGVRSHLTQKPERLIVGSTGRTTA